MGLRDLWDTIVNNDDICLTHILPRLNQADIKFLYDVNSETRALIMRSSRANDLIKKFKIEEMSSISTLEFAWNNVRWGEESRDEDVMMDEAWFCWNVAETNKLELLKWAREEKKCEWDENTIVTAALNGNLDILKYCLANESPGVYACCESAAQGGQLECLKYLHEEVRAPWNANTATLAIESDNTLHILEYLVEREYDEFDGSACSYAVSNGKLDCLKYLHETAKAPWDAEAVRYAHENNRSECLQYLLDKNCPLPEGWRYEHGELYTLSSESESESESES